MQYIRLGSLTDPTWTEFPSNLEHGRGTRRYVTLFKLALNGASLTQRENIALRASSIRAIPPPSPEVTPLKGLTGVQLQEVNLTDLASIVQEVASGMREPPVTAMQCPVNDIVGILHKLEALMNQTFCRFCYNIGTYCSCHWALAQAPPSLWTAPASRATTSTSTAGSAPPLYPPPGYPCCLRQWTLLLHRSSTNHWLARVQEEEKCWNRRRLPPRQEASVRCGLN